MAVISLPSKVYFSKVDKLQLLRGGLSMRSRYTGKRQVINFPFAVWVFEGTLIPMDGADANDWRRFLLALEGMKNTFRLPVPGADKPLSGYTANSTVSGALAARATTCTLTGTAGKTVLKAGDYFNIGDELKVATTDCVMGAGGTGPVTFQPATRKAYATGQAVTVQSPFIYLAFADAEQGGWTLERPVKHGIKLVCMEAIE